jgi:prepilin-type N-terminal cleavage/methylation domain-containing protein
MKFRQHKNRGFTLIEVTVTVAMFALIIYGITFLVAAILQNSSFQSRLLDNNDQARKNATNFTNEIRNAITSVTGSYPVEIASSQQIAFYTKSGSTVIRVRYYLLSGKLYRGVTTPSGNPPVYNLGTEVSTAVQNAMATQAGDTIFSYYDGNYNGISSALAQPVNPVSVRYIQMNLKIYRQGSRNNIGTYSVTAGGSIRNLKTNL